MPETEIVYQAEGYCPAEPDHCALNSEDSGAALILELCFDNEEDLKAKRFNAEGQREHGMFVRVQSYDERVWPSKGAAPNAHEEFKRLMGKRVRVTVEVLPE